MPTYDGSIRIDTRIDSKGFNTGVAAISGSLKGLAAAIGIAFGVGAVVAFGKTAVETASATESAWIGLRSVVEGQGRSFTVAKQFINEYIADGLVPLNNAVTAYKNLAMRGYDPQQIETTLTALKDASAFGRQASLSMGYAVQTATEGLKNENSILVDNAGVTKNVSVMWKEYAASIGTTVANLTKQQKIQAEVNGILNESRFQAGDAAKLAGTYAGQVSALSVSFYNLKVAIGSAIIPILSQVIAAIKPVIDWLVVLFNQFAQFISLLFGVKLGLAGVADTTQNAAAGAGDLADNTKKAEKAAKGALAAFDEINVLAQESGGGENPIPGGGVTPLPTPDTEPVDNALDAIRAKVEAFKKALLELFGPAITAFEKLKTALAGLGATVWAGLKWAWDNILVPLGKWVITDILPLFLEGLAAVVRILDGVLKAAGPAFEWFWNTFLKPIAEWAGGVIVEVLGWIVDRLNDFADWITANQELVTGFIKFLLTFAAIWLTISAVVNLVSGVMTVATAVIGAVSAAIAFIATPVGLVVIAIFALIAAIALLITNWGWVKEKAGEVWDWIVKTWSQLGAWLVANVVLPAADAFWKFWEDVAAWTREAWENVKRAWIGAGDWFRTRITQPIADWFSTAWENIKTFFASAWDWIKGIWEGAAAWFQTTVIDPVKQGFDDSLKGVQTLWETTWTGIRTFVKGVVNSIIDYINGMLGGMATGVNGVIRALNSLRINVPDWVPVIGGNAWSFNLATVSAPQIPRLATGAVIPPNAEFAAILGDQRAGRNLEAPEGLIRQIIREEMAALTADITLNNVLTLDGEVIFKNQKKIDRRHGTSLIAVKGAA